MWLSWLRTKAYWVVRTAVYRLSLLLAIFSVVEIYMHTFAGTNPNGIPPWGYYRTSLAIFAAVCFAIARLTWFPPDPIDVPQSIEPLPPVAESSLRGRKKRRRNRNR
jgi:hypothetical protein